jgi:hypothetical protein
MELREKGFRTNWDDLGCFSLADVPVLFPRFEQKLGDPARERLP